MDANTCKRCLLSETSDKRLYETVQAYIQSLPEDVKAAPEEYRRRLSICKGCGELLNGMCRQCGCFIEARAAKARAVCPKDVRFW